MENNAHNNLSIIIPAYNVSPYIERCLDSIYAIPITEDTFEVIVVDDCSTDDTYNILQKYARGHSNLRIFRQQENKRQGAARNVGIDAAQGEYITFCDADDYMLPEGVINALRAVEKSHADVCYFEMEYQNGPDDEWHLVEMPEATHNTIMSSKEYLENYYTCYYNGPVRCLYRTEFLKGTHIRFVEGVRWEDCDWTVKVYAKAKEIQFVDGVGYRYVQNDTNTCSIANMANTIGEQLYAGLRLLHYADEINNTLPNLANVLKEEARYRYVIGLLRMRNMSKYSVSDIRHIYQSLGDKNREELSRYKFTGWVNFALKYPTYTICLFSVISPIAKAGRYVITQIRNF